MSRKKLLVGFGAILSIAAADAPGAPVPEGADASRELAQAVSDWEQANSNGFGDPQNLEVTALEVFNGFLYAGTHNPLDPDHFYDGAQVFRSPDGVAWTAVTQPGFGQAHDNAPPAILDFVVFNGRIYAGTGRGNASQIWRSLNGTIWAPMNVTGFGDPDNVDVTAFAVYGGWIYAGVMNQVAGAQVWRSLSGDNNTWHRVAQIPVGVPARITGFAEFALDGGLYAAIELDEEMPAQIWRTYEGTVWETVLNNGFGDPSTIWTGGMAEFLGDLHAGAGNISSGAQVWRSTDGQTWTQAITPGFGDPNNEETEMVLLYGYQLRASVKNGVTGIEIWRTADGVLWEQINQDGFGDGHNIATNGSNATAEYLGQLYVGTLNSLDGGELWRTMPASGVEDLPAGRTGLALRAAVPNPTRARSRIAFTLPRDAGMSLEVIDVTGRLVRTLARTTMPAGSHEISWDGADETGHQVAAGVYFYRLGAGALESTRSLVVVR